MLSTDRTTNSKRNQSLVFVSQPRGAVQRWGAARSMPRRFTCCVSASWVRFAKIAPRRCRPLVAQSGAISFATACASRGVRAPRHRTRAASARTARAKLACRHSRIHDVKQLLHPAARFGKRASRARMHSRIMHSKCSQKLFTVWGQLSNVAIGRLVRAARFPVACWQCFARLELQT